MAITYKALAQTNPGVTTAVNVYQPSGGTEALVSGIRVVNYSAGTVDVTIYHDIDGTTFDDASTIKIVQTVAAKDDVVLDKDTGITMDGDDGGAIGVKLSVASSCTITVYGAEKT